MTELWLICLAVATPIAGVFGFAIQIRTVRKVRLENSKLVLEIIKLQKELESKERRIIEVTPEEIRKYGDIFFRRGGVNPGPDEELKPVKSSITAAIVLYAEMAVFILFLLYLLLDIYRVFSWLLSLL